MPEQLEMTAVAEDGAASREERRRLAQFGSSLIVALSRVLKACTLYDRHNTITLTLASSCVQAIREILAAEGQASLRMSVDNCYFNGRRISFMVGSYTLFRSLLDEMLQRGIGHLAFHEGVTVSALLDFLLGFLACAGQDNNYLLLRRQLEANGIRAIEVGPIEAPAANSARGLTAVANRTEMSEIYAHTLDLVKEVMDEAVTRKVVNVRKAKRTMQYVVDTVMTDENTMLGLATIRNYDEYTYSHSINVTFYAVALAQRLGFPKNILSHLGLAALFHDLGKLFIPLSILNKPAKLTPDEWDVVRTHPIAGAECLIRMKEWSDLAARMIVVAYEHHLNYDLSGYPRLTQKKDVALFSKIVTLADCYDALGRARAYRHVAYGSEKILGIMLEQSGKTFDPALVKIFINMIGIYPLGSLVELDTKERGVVKRIPEGSGLADRPLVCLFEMKDGVCIRGEEVDLREVDDATGAYKRTIVRSLNPNEFHFNLLEFFLT